MSKDIIQKSIKCLAKAKLETTYEVARNIVLDYITNLQTIEQQYSAILSENAELENRLDTLKIEISSLMSRYFYEKDFCLEDTHLDKLLRIIDGDNILQGEDNEG